jgi:hypothetical protein
MIENEIEGHENLPNVIELHYDTSFNFSNKLLSTLCIRHPGLEVIRNINDPTIRNTSPTVPLMNMIHDHKPTVQHDRAFIALQHAMKEHAPNLWQYPKIITSDREFKDLGSKFPNTQHAYCGFHIKRNAEFKAKELKMNTIEQNIVKHDIDKFLGSRDLEEYEHNKEEAFNRPPRPNGEPSVWQTEKGKLLQEWFYTNVDNDIKENAGRWKLEEFGMQVHYMNINILNDILHAI